MKIRFAPSAPADAGIVARIVNLDAMPAGLPATVTEGAAASRFAGKPGQVFDGFGEVDGKVRRLALAGAGKADAEGRLANLEKAGATLTAKYLTSGESSLTIDFTDTGLSTREAAAVLMGARLRSWRIDTYRTRLKDEQKPTLTEVVAVGAPDGTEAAWDDAAAVALGVEYARELVSEPGNVIFPESFVERCKARLDGLGVEITVLDVAEMEKLGMGALLGVGQGSTRPSRLLAMHWKGGNDHDAPLALVGKGVTFDSGGISIKPGAGMEDMKFDMGGAAAVAGTMLTLATRKAKANVVGVVGLVENMPDGNAQRPGDVVTSMSGQTIEVINTDAEGRLVLCDALTWTQQTFKPARIIDLATLTGAILISLGHEHAGMFTNDDTLAGDIDDAGKRTGDTVWRFPLGAAYDKMLDSPIADMKNIGGRLAGSITAAQFLKRFIETDTPWAHLDIAGTVWTDKPGATWEKGASGFGVRLLDDLVRTTIQS
ncbi:leucyl aminopeptidase [Croceicoccus naphthovorans]|uniref:Probable cytosol aminopeptidase n=1 Tax=Croceicoccus naphthovorans TaxID=1348774 RepID=A0A0G3XF04_9SPHN|nr:leucyl aminopeptidase [Croceicoccus naphthovorans]AKM09179.1 aminopeptidase A [Croceicoccus naphthovorans]MBB3990449.1 leucyl aminopeptidase [Croceicoccus naphthovorans]